MKVFPNYPILLLLMLAVCQLSWLTAFAQEIPSYKNRVGINVLAIPAENLVISYEHSFNKNGLWLGLEHRLNQLSAEKDQQMNSFALEYRYYPFSNEIPGNGLFGGIYSKYRWGEENTIDGNIVQHDYHAVFSGLNLGYRYNHKRLALSGFLGYGLALWSKEKTMPAGSSHDLNENYKNDFRVGITLGLGF
jgi:hypothetical protein